MLSLGALWENAGNPYDYADRNFATLISDAEWKAGEAGMGVELNDDSHSGGDTIELTNFDSTRLDGLLSFTYAICFSYFGTDSANEDSLGIMWGSLQGVSGSASLRILVRFDSNANQIDFVTQNPTTKALIVSSSSTNIKDGKPHTLVARFDSPNADKSLWFDGVNLGSTAAQTGALDNTAHTRVPEIFGGQGTTGPSFSDSPRVKGFAWALDEAAWTDSQIKQWSRDPFGPLRQSDDVAAVLVPPPVFGAGGAYTVTVAAG